MNEALDNSHNNHKQRKINQWLNNILTTDSLVFVIHNETGKIIK